MCNHTYPPNIDANHPFLEWNIVQIWNFWKIGDTFPFLGRKFANFWNNQNKFHHILNQILIGQDIIKAVKKIWASSTNLLPFNVIFLLGDCNWCNIKILKKKMGCRCVHQCCEDIQFAMLNLRV
jgi:hypothetical protein